MIFDLIYVIILSIIEGITEWLPISSTAHLLIFESIIKSPLTTEFSLMFDVCIQFGAVLGVVILYFKELNPFIGKKINKDSIKTWKLIFISMIPIVIFGFLLDDLIVSIFYNTLTIGITLIFYGIIFIIVEVVNKKEKRTEITPLTALLVGLVQVLALIPGTSRSGITIIFLLLLGINKTNGVKYSFFLSVPIMFGASILKIGKYILSYSIQFNEVILLLIGMVVTLLVSLFVIKKFMKYINKFTFKIFGIYRIIIGVLLLLFFL